MEKSSKTIESKCSHWAFRPILIGKLAHRKGNIKHVRTWSQAISSNFSSLFPSKRAKIAKNKCTHRSTNHFDASISTVVSLPLLCGYTPYLYPQINKPFPCIAIYNGKASIALWVHPFTHPGQVRCSWPT